MGQFLDQAETLLRGVVQSRDISTLVVLHHLRDLAEVLDKLKLYDECHLTGNCALDLAEALGRRSLEFRQEQAETLALIAELSVYQPRARTLFTQAVSICEEMVANNASYSNKYSLLSVLGVASHLTSDYLGAQWLERAVQLMTKQLPPTMVPPYYRSVIYSNYGNSLFQLGQYADAAEAYNESISISHTLVNNNPAKYSSFFANTLLNMGTTLEGLGKYDDAIAAYKEVLDICTAMSAQDPQYNKLMAKTLTTYGLTLGNINKISEAAVVQKQAILFYRNLAQIEDEHKYSLCDALHNYGHFCFTLGQHAESVLAYQESILLRRALLAADPEQEKYLRVSFHDIANSFHALGKCAEASSAANDALERNHGGVFGDCNYAPDFKSCYVCQRAVIPDSLSGGQLDRDKGSRPAKRPRSDAPLTSAETPKPTGETVNVSVHRKRDRVLGLFRGNRAQ